MDVTKRQITKIAREANKFSIQKMKADGLGSGEFDFIHLVRHHPGITQAEVREALKMDKGAAARRAASLEAKGYLVRKDNPDDRRSRCLYATEKAQSLKNSKTTLETMFYEWLTQELTQQERDIFTAVLDELYHRSKAESRAGFPNLSERIEEVGDEQE